MQVPVALVIGGSLELMSAMSEAALGAQVLVAECSVEDAATTAAQMRPLVMVMSEDVFDFDPDGFEALARDVRSRLLRVDAESPDARQLQSDLATLMLDAEEADATWGDPH